jgi:DNA polymerase/3'-5' exonuclease PolX
LNNQTRILHNKEAIKIKGIGNAIALKIAEIAQTGGLKKLEYLNSREDLNAIKIFSDIHGIQK